MDLHQFKISKGVDITRIKYINKAKHPVMYGDVDRANAAANLDGGGSGTGIINTKHNNG